MLNVGVSHTVLSMSSNVCVTYPCPPLSRVPITPPRIVYINFKDKNNHFTVSNSMMVKVDLHTINSEVSPTPTSTQSKKHPMYPACYVMFEYDYVPLPSFTVGVAVEGWCTNSPSP